MHVHSTAVQVQSGKLPIDVYDCVIASMVPRVSQKGNPMVVTVLEVINPPLVEVDGEKVRAAGRRTQPTYTVIPIGLGDMLSALSRAKINYRELLNLPEEIAWDDGIDPETRKPDENAYKSLIGRGLAVRLLCEERVVQKPVVRPDGSTEWVPHIGQDGKPVITGYSLTFNWSDVVGPAESLPIPY